MLHGRRVAAQALSLCLSYVRDASTPAFEIVSTSGACQTSALQRRWQSAYPAAAVARPEPAFDFGLSGFDMAAYERRLREQQLAASTNAAAVAQRRRRIADAPPLQLPKRQQAQQPEQERQLNGDKPLVDWRQVVEAARRSGQTVSGEQMLTDTFR